MSEAETHLNPVRGSNEGIVVYDGKCDICRQLASQINNKTGEDISILPLESPEAQGVLEKYYTGDPDHDFYFVSGGTCSKGLRAVPKIVQATGVRDFGGLMSKYFDLKYLADQSDDCSCDEDHSATADTTESGSGVLSRRAFTGIAATAAATLMPGTAVAREKERLSQGPPRDLEVRVATVTENGRGGFDTTIRNRPDLIHGPPSFDEATKAKGDGKSTASLKRSSNETNFEKRRVGDSGELRIDKVSTTYDINEAKPGIQRAASLQTDVADDAGKMDIYSAVVDGRRFELAINVGRGPAVLEGDEADIATTMASKVQHDLAYPTVDFVVPDLENATVSEYIEAYVTGVERLQTFYRKNNVREMVNVYQDVGDSLRETQRSFARNVHEADLTPMSSYLGISGVPNFARYALPPEDSQSAVVQGAGCDSGCGCGVDLCCGCGLGAGVCTAPIGKICGCCILECSCDIINCCADIL
ncbi:hypothetical protein [Halorubellus litoreus]|uniref:Uncharacterized protein n=1 Tax=Halorubellus litoreus TaxID=755308 RepID=A0ABD5VJE5_9EURY